MTKKDKIKESFLTAPRTIPLMQIRSFLISEGFVEVNAGGSHFKIQGKDGRAYIVPLHHGDCLWVYKRQLLNFYLSYQKGNEH